MQKIIEEAIKNKKLLAFNYGHHPRIVEPHVLGMKNGVAQILGYQVDGSSNSGRIPEWRRFDLEKMSGLSIGHQSFPGPRPCPSGVHSAWDHIYVIVS